MQTQALQAGWGLCILWAETTRSVIPFKQKSINWLRNRALNQIQTIKNPRTSGHQERVRVLSYASTTISSKTSTNISTTLLQGIGNVSECAEFNFHADPEAAHAVLRLTRSSFQCLMFRGETKQFAGAVLVITMSSSKFFAAVCKCVLFDAQMSNNHRLLGAEL